MKKYKLLDCTLRDGGFVNDWNFGYNCINNIIERLEKAKIDIIEVGYLRDFVQYNKNSTQFPNTDAINATLNKKNYKRMMVALMDYGCCDINCIEEKKKSLLDGIRLTFRKKEIDKALELGKKIQQKGYLLFLQPVAITDYDAKEVIDLVEKINNMNPYAVCMVDTYGFMNKQDLKKYFYLFDSSLRTDISLGYHSHNNYQLSYANAVELLELPSDRELIIDSSVFGMGKGAGNLNTELMITYFNENAGGNYDVNHVLEIISMYLEKEREHAFWGYNLKYYLAATNDCHHKYVQFLLERKTLTIESINKILFSIEPKKKTSFDQEYIEELYNKYQEAEINDEQILERIANMFAKQEILILAPGYSLIEQKDTVKQYIEKKKPLIISVNHYIPEYDPEYIFVSNGIRYSQLENKIDDIKRLDIKIIATSNISPTVLSPDYIVNYKSLLLQEPIIKNNAVLMLFRLLLNAGIQRVSVAGFDGFRENSYNYYDTDISLEDNLLVKNEKIKSALSEIDTLLSVNFITDTLYREEE